MKTSILLFLLLQTFFASAQDLKTLVPKGSKVFLQVNDKSAYKKSYDYLEKWGYWKIVENKKDADFNAKWEPMDEKFGEQMEAIENQEPPPPGWVYEP